MDVLKECASSFAHGFADSLRGFLPAYLSIKKSKSGGSLAKQEQRKEVSRSNSAESKAEQKSPMTELERRRLERSTHRSLSKQRKSVEQMPSKPPKLWTRVMQIAFSLTGQGSEVVCILGINVGLITAFYLVWYLVLRLVSSPTDSTSEVQPPSSHLPSTLGMIAVLPFFMFTRLWNCLWFQDVANAASCELSRDCRPCVPVSMGVADFCVSFLLELAFLCQSYLVALVPLPYVSHLATYVHFCLLYSLYSFEYPWMACGVELRSRLSRLQHNWLYFVGFGTPLTLMTCLSPNFIVNGCIFGIAFPVFIVSSCRAKPGGPPPSLCPLFVFTPSLYVVNRVSKFLASKLI